MYLEDLANCWRWQDTVPLYVLPKETWRYSQESRCSSPSEVHDNPVHRKSRHLKTLISVISSKLFPESQAPLQSSCAIHVHLNIRTPLRDSLDRLGREEPVWKRLAMVAVDLEVLALGSVRLDRLSLSPGKRSGLQVVVSRIYSTWP